MFYKLRMENNNRHWVVLELDANEILKMDCAFCYKSSHNNSEINKLNSNKNKLNSNIESIKFEFNSLNKKEKSDKKRIIPSNIK